MNAGRHRALDSDKFESITMSGQMSSTLRSVGSRDLKIWTPGHDQRKLPNWIFIFSKKCAEISPEGRAYLDFCHTWERLLQFFGRAVTTSESEVFFLLLSPSSFVWIKLHQDARRGEYTNLGDMTLFSLVRIQGSVEAWGWLLEGVKDPTWVWTEVMKMTGAMETSFTLALMKPPSLRTAEVTKINTLLISTFLLMLPKTLTFFHNREKIFNNLSPFWLSWIPWAV